MAYGGTTTKYSEPATGVTMATPDMGSGKLANAVVNYNAAGTEILTSTNEGYVRIRQNAVPDANNTSVANLNAGASFTGASTDTTGVALLQVSLYATQNCTVQIWQSRDGSAWHHYDQFDYYANTGRSWDVRAEIGYWKVVVTNTGPIATTTLQLDSYLCPIGDPTPRALDQYGMFKVSINGLQDHYGFSAENTPNDEQRTCIPYRLVGSTFTGAVLDSTFWTATLGSGGTATVGGAQVVLASGTSNTAILQSVRTARYVGGAANRFRCQMRLPVASGAGVANTVLQFGAFDGTDGCYFQITWDGTGVQSLAVVTRKTNTPTAVTSFNGNLGAAYSVGAVALTYEIYWNNKTVYFVINGELLHTVSASSTTWADTLHLPVRFVCTSSGSNSLAANIRVGTIYRMGNAHSSPTDRLLTATTAGMQLKYGPSVLHRLILSDVKNNCAITVYDGTTTGGTLKWQSGTMSAASAPSSIDMGGMHFNSGIFVVISGANCNLAAIFE